MGWLALLGFGVVAMALMIFLDLRRPAWSLAGAALMLGAAGYAWQGRPMLAASPAKPVVDTGLIDPPTIELRNRLFGQFTLDGAYLIASDAMARSGDDRAAVSVLLGGIRALPRSLALWTGLGSAYAAHDGDRVSPASLFAFNHAMRMAPEHPAPPFFLGLAYVRSGEFVTARRYWARALALSAPGTTYRTEIAARLALLDRYLAMTGQATR